MSRYTDEVLGHGNEADGIEEYDNPLPDWWLGMFFVSVIWGIGYGVNFHFVAGDSQAGRYEAEMLAAAEKWPQPEQAAGPDMSEANLAAGGEVFAKNCVACHGAALEGGIGPNLVDTEWIHGGDFASIVKTITEGVGAKGMPQWGTILGPNKIASVSSYILSENTGEAPAAAPSGAAETPAGDAVAGTDGAPAAVDGQAVFTQYCVACHAADMTGGVGPNLVDAEWIHGGTLEDITRTVTNGVPEKGMISWKGTLDEAQIAAVAQFVHEKSHPE